MRLSNPLFLLSAGIVLAAASCTLITDVDRSKIPDGQNAGSPGVGGDSSGGSSNQPAGGESGNAGKGGGDNGSGGSGGDAGGSGGGGGEAGAAGSGGAGGGADAGAGGAMAGNSGAGGST